MKHQILLPEDERGTRGLSPLFNAALGDLMWRRLAIVNVLFYGMPRGKESPWVLIDAGIPGRSGAIMRYASDRFAPGVPPTAIILTHGHFDHVGTLEKLAAEWNAPIFAHPLELPYLNGQASYPPADPTVGGGLMARLSVFYPRGPIDVSRWLYPLPEDGSVPAMPGWRWLHTPGHTPGHISLWRESDRTIIAGDAFITTNQESAYAVVTQKPELHGPPMYYTQNWDEAEVSVQKLAALDPELVITGHGPPLRGDKMRAALYQLAQDFRAVAVPGTGEYVDHPTSAETGTAYAYHR